MPYVKIIFFLFALSIIGCKKDEIIKSNENTTKFKPGGIPASAKTKEEFKKSHYFKEDRVKEDKYDVLKKGNEKSYSELLLYYGYNISKKHELIPYTLIMIEKHKKYNYCTNAFENLYEFYTEKNINNFYDGSEASYIPYFKTINTLEPSVKNYCLYFLVLGSKNNDANSVKYLEIMYRYGYGFNKNIKKADSLRKISAFLSKYPNGSDIQ